MHSNSLEIMEKLLNAHAPAGAGRMCYDIGSLNVNGTYKKMITDRGWAYTGIDISAGPNVDIVLPEHSSANWSEFLPPAPLVVSGQCLEHTRWPWRWIEQVRELIAKDGILLLIAPASWPQHRYPIDCWRVLPDGMQALADWARLTRVEAGMNRGENRDTIGEDCWAVMRKDLD